MPALVREPDRQQAVAALAERFHASVDSVARLYACEVTALACNARVTRFVHTFAARKTEEAMRSTASTNAASTPLSAPTALG